MKQPTQKMCYVIMPFSEHAGISEKEWDETYTHFFKPAIESSGFGYKCIKSEIIPGAFTKEIVENLKKAHLVLADITGFNGNVMWELGVRHSLSPRTIIVTNKDVKAKKFISDLSIYGVVEYSTKGPKENDLFRENIKKILKKIKVNPEKPDNPVFDFLKIEDLVMKSYEEIQIRNKLTGLLSEMLENIRVAEIHTEGENPITIDFIGFYRFNQNAILELLVTNYIYFDNINPGMAALRNWIHHANQGMQTLSDYMDANRSKEDKERAVKGILMAVKEVKVRSEKAVKLLNQILKDQNKLTTENIPNVIINDKKHEKLLD